MARKDRKSPSDWSPGQGPLATGDEAIRAAEIRMEEDGAPPAAPDNPFRATAKDWTRAAEAGRPPEPDRETLPLPGAGFLDALFIDFPFPADHESVVCHLALDAYAHGGPGEIFHDMVVQLDRPFFKDIHDLKRVLAERFAWESAHDTYPGGYHGR